VFSKLTISSVYYKNGRQWCSCVCSCGGTKEASYRHLILGKTTHCGCIKRASKTKGRAKGTQNPIVVVGDKIGKLTILDEFYFNKRAYCHVQCACGSPIKAVLRASIYSHHTLSCGCLHTEACNKLRKPIEPGAIFGKLTVIKSFYGDKAGVLCTVQCSCGSEPFNVIGANLKRNSTTSCGKCQYFFHEEQCKNIVECVFNKPFQKAPRWDSPIDMELDMYNKELQIAVEFNGQQHYYFPTKYHKTIDKFNNQIKRDKLRQQKCKDNGITLIAIPYWLSKEEVTWLLLDFLQAIEKTCEKH
jgi:hypothetical protein